MIWVHSIINAWKKRQFGDIAVAGWNTYAQARNIWSAAKHTPGAFQSVTDFFLGGSKSNKRRSSKDSAAGFLIILLVILAIGGGALTTAAIVKNADKKYVLEVTSTFD